jgi:hypothetical protein
MTFRKVCLEFCPKLKQIGANTFTGAFYMVGDFESARAKGEKILAELEKS